MTTDLTHPENVSALPEKVNTTGPTREYIEAIIRDDVRTDIYGDLYGTDRAADAIIALYAPHIAELRAIKAEVAGMKALTESALARLERERDEARNIRQAWNVLTNECLALKARAETAEAALATAEAEGMRKAAGIVCEIAERHREGAHNCHMEDLRDAAQLASYTARSIDDVEAAILAAIPKEK